MTENQEEAYIVDPVLLEMVNEAKADAFGLINSLKSEDALFGFITLKVMEKVYEDHIPCPLPSPAGTWAGFASIFQPIIDELAATELGGEGGCDIREERAMPLNYVGGENGDVRRSATMIENENEGYILEEVLEMIIAAKAVAFGWINSPENKDAVFNFITLKIAQKAYEEHIPCPFPSPMDTWAGFARIFEPIIDDLVKHDYETLFAG